MTSKVGPKGQVVIPKAFRDQLGIQPGDNVDFSWANDQVIITVQHANRPLRGRYKDGPDLTELLMEERRKDREREDHTA